MASETQKNDESAPEAAAGVRRRGLLRFGTLLTAFTGASAISALSANSAHAGPGDKNPPTSYVPMAEKGVASGVATLDLESKIPRPQLPDLSATYASKTAVALNAKDYGVVGDGVANDTAALQAFLNLSTLSSPKAFYLPRGTYRITAPLNFPFAPGTTLKGAGRLLTEIVQDTDGVNIFTFLSDNIHTITFEGFGTKHKNPQTTASGSAFYYRVTGGTGSGFYHHIYRDLNFRNSYRGLALADNDSSQSMWGLTGEDLYFYEIAGAAIYFKPAAPIGMPNNNFRHTVILNYSGADCYEQALILNGSATTFNGLDIEGRNKNLIYVSSGGFCAINGLHVEQHRFHTAFASVLEAFDTPVTVRNWNVTGVNSAANTDAITLFKKGNVNASLDIGKGVHSVNTNNGSAYLLEVVYGSEGGQSIIAQDIRKDTGGIGAGSPGLKQPGTGNADALPVLAAFGSLPDGTTGVQLGDSTIKRTAAKKLTTNAGLALGAYTTATRPAAVIGAGTQIYDTTLSKPVWSNGTAWTDAMGNVV